MIAATCSELEDYRRQFADVKSDAAGLTGSLTATQLAWRPDERRWSIAECLAHLRTSALAYLPRIDGALAEARTKGWKGEGPFRHGWLGNWFVRSLEPPPRFRAKSPTAFVPPPIGDIGCVVDDFMVATDTILARLAEAQGLDLARPQVISPASRFVRLSLGQAFALLAAHSRRHLWQAWEVRKSPGFPEGIV